MDELHIKHAKLEQRVDDHIQECKDEKDALWHSIRSLDNKLWFIILGVVGILIESLYRSLAG